MQYAAANIARIDAAQPPAHRLTNTAPTLHDLCGTEKGWHMPTNSFIAMKEAG